MSDQEDRQEALGEAPQEAKPKKMKGGHDPRELAARSAEVRRRKKAAKEAAVTEGDPTDAAIVRALRRKAGKGDAVAARELREWLDRDTGDLRGDAWLELLTREDRDALRGMIRKAKERLSEGGEGLAAEAATPHPRSA